MLSFTTVPYDYYGPINYIDVASDRLDWEIDFRLRKESPDEKGNDSYFANISEIKADHRLYV